MSKRPTAFARVPRNTQNKEQRIRKDLVRIDANFLERFERANLNPDLATIMTKTDTTVSISINAQSAVGYSLVDKTGKTVADKTDIKRIQTMSSSITKERKAALGEEVGQMTKFTLAAFVQKSNEFDAVTPILRFHKSFVGVYRSVNTQYQTIVKNINSIEAIPTTEGATDDIKNMFIEMGRRISIAVGEYLYHRANLQEDATPQKLNAFLFRKRIPIYIFNKLALAVISTSAQGFDVRHLLFPKDPSKGAFLTYKEIRNVEFRNDLMGLMAGSQILIQLASDDGLIRQMTNLANTVGLDDFDEPNSVASKMANTPFYVLPFEGAVEASDIFGFLAKNGVRGVNWAAGTVLTPPDLLKFYGTIAKRMAYALVSRPMQKATLLGRMFEGFTYDVASDQRDIFVQLKAWSIRPGSTATWFSTMRNWGLDTDTRSVVRAVFNDIAMVSPNHAISEQFAQILRGDIIPNHKGSVSTTALIFTEVKNLAVSMKERRIDVLPILGDRISFSFDKKVKAPQTNRSGIQERSRLTQGARTALTELNGRGFSALALRMQTWFRLFLDETVQEAVSSVFLARLESFLDAPLELTREDRQGFMEALDPGDDFEGEVEPNAPDELVELRDNPDED
jgi:hypothetical protein